MDVDSIYQKQKKKRRYSINGKERKLKVFYQGTRKRLGPSSVYIAV